VDLQEKKQLDRARRMATVKARTRPWKAIIALALAVAAGVTSWAADDFGTWYVPNHLIAKIITASAAAAFFLLASLAVVSLASQARDVLQPVTGSAHAAVVRSALVLVGAIATVVIALALFKVPVGQLVLGGAVTTILIGIAAQQSLANVFAGIVLLLSHPFSVGDTVRFRSGSLGGPLEGTVTEIGITYLRLETADGVLHVPNSQALSAAVGLLPSARQAPASPDQPGAQQP
jgi:small-conductance mechanosensitive channel